MSKKSLKERLLLDSANEDEREERRLYLFGLMLSVGLTVLSSLSVIIGILPRPGALGVLFVLALAQIVVHLCIFLHIT